jgi:hypothetical protein
VLRDDVAFTKALLERHLKKEQSLPLPQGSCLARSTEPMTRHCTNRGPCTARDAAPLCVPFFCSPSGPESGPTDPNPIHTGLRPSSTRCVGRGAPGGEGTGGREGAGGVACGGAEGLGSRGATRGPGRSSFRCHSNRQHENVKRKVWGCLHAWK